MNQIVVAPEVLDRFHQLAQAMQRSDDEVINEALSGYLTADRHYVEKLSERIVAAERGEFADVDEVASFFADSR